MDREVLGDSISTEFIHFLIIFLVLLEVLCVKNRYFRATSQNKDTYRKHFKLLAFSVSDRVADSQKLNFHIWILIRHEILCRSGSKLKILCGSGF